MIEYSCQRFYTKKGEVNMQKTWNLKKYDNGILDKIKNEYNVSDIMAKLLVSRNIEFEDVDNFLNGSLEDLKDPYGIKDMDKLVERIDKAIRDKIGRAHV